MLGIIMGASGRTGSENGVFYGRIHVVKGKPSGQEGSVGVEVCVYDCRNQVLVKEIATWPLPVVADVDIDSQNFGKTAVVFVSGVELRGQLGKEYKLTSNGVERVQAAAVPAAAR